MNRTHVIAATLTIVVIGTTASSCDEETPVTSAQQSGQQQTESTFKKQQASTPYPGAQLTNSLERANLRERLLRLNSASKIGYVYLMSMGKIIGYYAIRGKVSNTDSQMTTSTTVERKYDSWGNVIATYDAPGDDGTYGPNESGNFFFTTEGVLVESDLQYLYADAPLPIDVPRLNAAKVANGKPNPNPTPSPQSTP